MNYEAKEVFLMTIANVCKNAKVMIMTTFFFFNASWIVMTITALERVGLLTYLLCFMSSDGFSATV